MRKFFIIGCLILSTSLSAQSLEEQFRAFQQQATKSYTDFRDEANQQYAEFLRGTWDYYRQAPAIHQPQEKELPPVQYNKEQKQPEQLPVEVIPTPAPQPSPQPVAPIEENEKPSNSIQIIYHGTEFSFRVPHHGFQLDQTEEDALAKAWEKITTEEYNNLLFDCLQNRDFHHLCDWAYIELTKQLAEKLYGIANEAVFLHGFILIQSGYAMRYAQAQNGRLYTLVGSQYQLYDRGYFEINGMFYYPLENIDGGLHICSGSYEKENPFSLYIQPEQSLTEQTEQMPARKSNNGIKASCSINLNAIHFYNEYPTGQIGGDCGTRWATYANAPMEECVKQSLYPTLMQAIRGVPEAQAVNKLLNWVQTAFEYEYDDKVWGHDRAFFPSETLHYPYADCEDRAILFSRIVRDLLKLDVVLLYYPGHLATAVAFHQDIKGDYVQKDGTKYIVCDPTYIGAPIGMTMPGMDNQTAKLIPLQQ